MFIIVRIYGYTVDSIVLNKYPPLNHLLVSLFINKPHEYPIEQKVSDVFESGESFKILDNKFKDFLSRTSILANQKISSIHIEKDLQKTSYRIKNYKKDMNMDKTMVQNKSNNEGVDDSKVKDKDLKQRISVLKNHEHLLQSFIPIFLYISDAGSVVYDIAMRIDKTAQQAIIVMIDIEKENTDRSTTYKTGTGAGGKAIKEKSNKQKLAAISKKVALDTRDDAGTKVTYFSGNKSVRKIAGQK